MRLDITPRTEPQHFYLEEPVWGKKIVPHESFMQCIDHLDGIDYCHVVRNANSIYVAIMPEEGQEFGTEILRAYYCAVHNRWRTEYQTRYFSA